MIAFHPSSVRRASSTIVCYRLYFASDIHESLSEHLSPSNLGQVRSLAILGKKKGQYIKLKEYRVNTLEATFVLLKHIEPLSECLS